MAYSERQVGPVKTDLTPEEKAERRTGIGGSDAAKVMAGDWHELWLQKTGRKEPEKIMSDWNYVWRMATETLQLDWFEHTTGRSIVRRNTVARSSVYPFMRATFDGIIGDAREPINAKHLSGWTRDARNWAVDKYVWQMIHETVVEMPPTMTSWITLIVGEKEPELIPIEADPVSVDRLIAAEEEFWGYVQRDEPPDGKASVAPIVEWDRMRSVNMATSNSWAEYAEMWLENIVASRRCDKAAKELRALVEPDVREAMGHGVVIKRSRDNKLLIKEHLE